MVPYPRNVNFTGRKSLLTALREKLCDIAPSSWNHRVALYGLGGVGKTQLAIEYAHSHRSDYDGIYWINAVSEATVLAGFQDIARRTRCVESTQHLNPSELAQRVLQWLNLHQSWLLVIDNLDQIEVIGNSLPDRSQGRHTLITTRNSFCDHIPAQGLEVSGLEEYDAIDLLLCRSRLGAAGETPEANAVAAEIVKELGYLPLAIEQAAAYIREALRDIFKFLPSYRKDRKVHHSRLSRGNRPFYASSVSNTWHLSFWQIERNNKDATKLLHLLSFLNPDGILTDFLKAGKEALDDELRDIILDERRFHDALAELERFSLIQRERNNGEKIQIHRLVQAVIQEDMPPELFSTMIEVVVRFCDSAFPDSNYGDSQTRDLKRRFKDQVVLPLLSLHPPNSHQFGLLLHRIGVFLRDDGNFQQAVELLGEAANILDILQGTDDVETLTAMSDLGQAFELVGRLKDATILRENVLEICRRLFESGNPQTLYSMANLASSYRNQGRWMEAVKLEEVVLKSRISLLGEDHPDTLRAMANLALTYSNQGGWDDALKLQEVVLKSWINLLGEDHPDTLTAMTSLASYYFNERPDEASILFEKSHEGMRKVLGDEHPGTLWASSWVARSYQNNGKLDEAISLLEKVVETMKRVVGENHPDTVKQINTLELWRKGKQDTYILLDTGA